LDHIVVEFIGCHREKDFVFIKKEFTMKSTVQLFSILILAMAAFGQYTTAKTGGGGAFKFKGLSTDTFFSSMDPTGCINTDVSMFASEQIVRNQPGQGTPSSGLSLFIYQYNVCANEQVVAASGFAPLSDTALQISGNLDSAVLNATANVFDEVSGSSFDVTLALAWRGTSSLGHQMAQFQYSFGGCKTKSHSDGAFRFAEATGSVTIGQVNLTPAPSVTSTIFSGKSGTVEIGCG
jgi:hypothetical protein